MLRMLLWRLGRTGLAVWALASVVFLLSHRELSTATRLTLPDDPILGAGSTASPAARRAAEQALQQRLGLDRPLFYASRSTALGHRGAGWRWNGPDNQYHRWLMALLRGDLGTSFRTGQPVTARLYMALGFTLPLTGAAALLAALGALALAQWLASGPRWGGAVRAGLVALHGVPLFVVALLLLLALANPEALALFPAYGLDQPTDSDANGWSQFGTYVQHLVLPVLALALTALPELTLQLADTLQQELRTDYATTARAKGLAEALVIRRHALRNALLPTLTQLTELLPALVAGAVVVEVVFALPGMGRLLATAAAARDYPVLVGGVLLTSGARLISLLLADGLYFWADPRIRWHA